MFQHHHKFTRLTFKLRFHIYFSPSRTMTTRLSKNDAISHLQPSDETLKMLRQVDFSSFNESLSAEEISPKVEKSVYEVQTDSDDPFDSDDLKGIDEEDSVTFGINAIKKEETRTPNVFATSLSDLKSQNLVNFNKDNLQRQVKQETLPKPIFPFKTPVKPISQTGRSQNPEGEKGTPTRTNLPLSSPLFMPILLSPAALQPFKKPRVTFSPEGARGLHTSATVKEEAEVKQMPVSRSKNLMNLTIQLATQQQLAPNEMYDQTGQDEKVVKPIILSAEQERVLQLALQGKSIFFTGSAGTGKSILLKAIIKQLKKKYGDTGQVAVTASTGLAACNIGGTTVHSFAGIGLGKGKLDDLLKVVRRNRKATARWNSISVLIIDEVSMVEGHLFDKLDWIARKIRRKPHLPFGGIQVIVCGDFYQLPPVSKTIINPDGTELKDDTMFAFESETWKSALHSRIVLKEVFRQKGDQQFITMLNEMREGFVSGATEREFMRLSRPLDCPAGIVPTELYATRFEVENANNIKLNRLHGSAQVYEARDGGSLPPSVKALMLTNFLAPQKLFLKEKAQVMCIKNYDSTLVNGSLGQVIKFIDRDTYMCELVLKDHPDLSYEEFQKELLKAKVKLQLSQQHPDADAETIEELSQRVANPGTLLDSVFNFLYDGVEEIQSSSEEINKEGVKAEVAAKCEQATEEVKDSTQTRKLDLPDVKEEIKKENTRRKLEFLEKLRNAARGEKYPLVRFLNPDGVTTRDVLIEPEIWEINDEHTNEVLCSRVQLPLMLAWALSIHKSQGQTLQKVKIDLTRIFENGQAYVALSRAVSRDGLQVLNFRREKVRAHQEVVNFYETLSSAKDEEDR